MIALTKKWNHCERKGIIEMLFCVADNMSTQKHCFLESTHSLTATHQKLYKIMKEMMVL